MNDIFLASIAHKVRKELQTPTVKSGRRAKRSLGYADCYWQNGQTLKISFHGSTTAELKTTIYNIARKWLEFANLEFELVDDNDDSAQIRIRTDDDPSINQSNLGTLSDQHEEPSMHLGVRPEDDQFELTVLHEFGHALGLAHEHQHPNANIQWNFEAIKNTVMEEMIKQAKDQEWADTMEETVLVNILPLSVEGTSLTLLEYDRRSIMHYPVKAILTLDGWSNEANHELSAKDKQLIAMIYPGRVNLND